MVVVTEDMQHWWDWLKLQIYTPVALIMWAFPISKHFQIIPWVLETSDWNGEEIWYDLDNPEELKIAREVSPVNNIDKIKKPLFVVQGANDPRVNINESDQIVTALRAKGFEVPYMVKYNEGHGYYREENRMDFYGAMMGFLAKYLK